MRSKISVLVLAWLAVAACGGGGGSLVPGSGPYFLTFSLDASFQIPHGGEPIRIALVRLFDGYVVAEGNGSISITDEPSFTFAPGAVLEQGYSYAVRYWIDSNIGGGTPGVCDAKDIDHQWSVEFFLLMNDINFTVSYQPLLTEDVCSTFP